MNFLMQSGKRWARQMADDWLQGCRGGRIVRGKDTFSPGPVALYGVAPDTFSLWKSCLREGRDFYYIDNAYFSAGHADDKFIRVTRNRMQCDGFGSADGSRFEVHGVSIKPWRYGGKGAHILVTCQSEWWYTQHGTTLQVWMDDLLTDLRRHSDRPIRIRFKPKQTYKRPPNFAEDHHITRADDDVPFLSDLAGAWAVVTFSSNTAVEAILEGVPAFVTGQSAAEPMACDDLSMIESPRWPKGREQWARNLAANQWTPREMRRGICWRDLNDGGGTPANP